MISRLEIRASARTLREQGLSYGQIRRELRSDIPKSTIAHWCRDVVLSARAKQKRDRMREASLRHARKRSAEVRAFRKDRRTEGWRQTYQHLSGLLLQKEVALISLALLYACEGSKNTGRACVTFGNSDPGIIRTFLTLLRRCHVVNERKFRCTVQGRADQDMDALQRYWSGITNIPLQQFYAPRADPRTKGRISSKKAYRGVCRIDYLSSDLFQELMFIGSLLVHEGP